MNGRNVGNCTVHACPSASLFSLGPASGPQGEPLVLPYTEFFTRNIDEWNWYPEDRSTRAVENGDCRVRLEPPRLLRSRYRSLPVERKKNEKSWPDNP